MKNFDNEIETLKLYKAEKITEFAFQQEFSNFVGTLAEVHVASNPSKNTASSYGIFVYPEKHINGVKLIYLIDKNVIFNGLYTESDIVERLDALKEFKQGIIKEFLKFCRKNRDTVVTLGKALALYLRIYSSTLDTLHIDGKDFLPESGKVLDAIVKLEDGIDVDENVESLIVNNILPKEILDVAEALIHDSPEGEILTTVQFVTDGRELPSVNLGQQEIRDLCTGNFGIGNRDHREVRHDYTPSTNQ